MTSLDLLGEAAPADEPLADLLQLLEALELVLILSHRSEHAPHHRYPPLLDDERSLNLNPPLPDVAVAGMAEELRVGVARRASLAVKNVGDETEEMLVIVVDLVKIGRCLRRNGGDDG